MMEDSSDEVCELRPPSTAIYKLPSSLIDVCLIYGVDEKTSGSLLDYTGEVRKNYARFFSKF